MDTWMTETEKAICNIAKKYRKEKENQMRVFNADDIVNKTLYYKDSNGRLIELMRPVTIDVSYEPYEAVTEICVKGTLLDRVDYSAYSAKYYGVPRNSGRYPWRNVEPDWHTIDKNIKKVIFKDPATIVVWKDGSKTVVKCGRDDTFSQEKGLAMAICKKMMGNKGSFNELFKKWTDEIDTTGHTTAYTKGFNDGRKIERGEKL